MQSQVFLPSPSLQPFIKYFWTLETGSEENGVFRFSPDGYPELIFQLEGQQEIRFSENRRKYISQSGVFGQFNRNLDMAYQGKHLALLVKLYPWSLSHLISENSSAFTNSITSIFWIESLAGRLKDRFAYHQDMHLLVKELEITLQHHIIRYEQAELMADLTTQIQGQFKQPVKEILSAYGLSTRRLEQLCKQHIGLSPKQLQRMTRFKKATQFLMDGMETAAIVQACGYFDWAHFSKDMRFYLELSPTDFLANISPSGLLYNLHFRN